MASGMPEAKGKTQSGAKGFKLDTVQAGAAEAGSHRTLGVSSPVYVSPWKGESEGSSYLTAGAEALTESGDWGNIPTRKRRR